MNCQLPPPLKPGDLLRVITPSGALRETEAFDLGVEIWRSRGYRVEVDQDIHNRWGYLAGKDSDRRNHLLSDLELSLVNHNLTTLPRFNHIIHNF